MSIDIRQDSFRPRRMLALMCAAFVLAMVQASCLAQHIPPMANICAINLCLDVRPITLGGQVIYATTTFRQNMKDRNGIYEVLYPNVGSVQLWTRVSKLGKCNKKMRTEPRAAKDLSPRAVVVKVCGTTASGDNYHLTINYVPHTGMTADEFYRYSKSNIWIFDVISKDGEPASSSAFVEFVDLSDHPK